MTEQFTEKDVELVAQAMRDANSHEAWTETYPLLPMAHFAEAALRVLAERGRLLPDGFTFHRTDSGDLVFYEVRTAAKFLLMSSTWNRDWFTRGVDGG